MALLPPIWTPGVDELDTFAGEMTKKEEWLKRKVVKVSEKSIVKEGGKFDQ